MLDSIETPSGVPLANAPVEIGRSGRFVFVLTHDAPVPPWIGRRLGPWRFLRLFFAGLDGDGIFIPLAFWHAPKSQGGIGAPATKPAAAMYKLRSQWRDWIKGNPAFDNRRLLIVERREGDRAADGSRFTAAGISLLLVVLDASEIRRSPPRNRLHQLRRHELLGPSQR